MKKKTIGVFYDGESSVSQEVVLTFDSQKEVFIFENLNNETYTWELAAVTFNKRRALLELQHGNDPVQILKIEDVPFISELTIFRNTNGHLGWYQKMLDLGTKIHLGFAVFIIGFVALCYLYAIPWVGEKSVILIPEEYDDRLGNSAWAGNEYFMDVDSKKTKLLNDFAKQLNLQNTKNLKFTVVKSDEINAFALPDGNIVVFSGILKEMEDYDELVGLLGHEASHVNNRHSMKMLCRSLSGYLFVSVILGDANGIMATIGDNVNNFQSLSFSREFEHQADADGFKILIANKVNPQGMSNLFKRLQQHHSISIPEFLSSHPVTENRIDFINKMIKNQKNQQVTNPQLEKLFAKLKQ
nr:M48 family metallopeptidase [uncultured Flavobacterium sp.]